MNGIIQEVVFKFDDGDYTIRPNGVGDTILGPTAHKIMSELHRHERGRNSSSVYTFSMTDKIEFISKRSEFIAQS